MEIKASKSKGFMWHFMIVVVIELSVWMLYGGIFFLCVCILGLSFGGVMYLYPKMFDHLYFIYHLLAPCSFLFPAIYAAIVFFYRRRKKKETLKQV
ncbi:hypothetical protein [Paenibacillus sp. NEAU-GSW1]|uniref:hypothetical protein n=1 Tax=Paenibacillus sp. NEAU-GSW1 TaxID=2682486 RepID=UPI0012E22384|nr:hypothetical protein [Paenibacillus sp. NEAU-GSW1]MUT64850.1 hypothetical protein [Paenibacillus sp. NEAU-GSW1]